MTKCVAVNSYKFKYNVEALTDFPLPNLILLHFWLSDLLIIPGTESLYKVFSMYVKVHF